MDDIKKVRDVTLINGLDFKQVHENQNSDFFIKVSVARSFVHIIRSNKRDWLFLGGIQLIPRHVLYRIRFSVLKSVY